MLKGEEFGSSSLNVSTALGEGLKLYCLTDGDDTSSTWTRSSRRKWENYRPWEIQLEFSLISLRISFSSVRWKTRAADLKDSHWLCDSMTLFCG